MYPHMPYEVSQDFLLKTPLGLVWALSPSLLLSLAIHARQLQAHTAALSAATYTATQLLLLKGEGA